MSEPSPPKTHTQQPTKQQKNQKKGLPGASCPPQATAYDPRGDLTDETPDLRAAYFCPGGLAGIGVFGYNLQYKPLSGCVVGVVGVGGRSGGREGWWGGARPLALPTHDARTHQQHPSSAQQKNSYYPAFVFYSVSPSYIWKATAHEVGHTVSEGRRRARS